MTSKNVRRITLLFIFLSYLASCSMPFATKYDYDLYRAAVIGDDFNVKYSYQTYGANPNIKDKEGSTPLIVAVYNGHYSTVKLLLSIGARPEINAKNKYGTTALMIACFKGHADIVKLLIDSGADINAKESNTSDDTSLMIAIQRNHNDIVKLLIDSGADVNAKNKYGTTALKNAVWYDNINAAKALIKAGADINLADIEDIGYTGIAVVQKNGDFVITSLKKAMPAFMKGIKVNDKIIKLDNETTTGMNYSDLRKKLSGKIGTPVIISIMREGLAEPQDFTINREDLPVFAQLKKEGVSFNISKSKHVTQKETPEEHVGKNISNISFGNYHALIIGNNEYMDYKKLNTAVNDAKVIGDILKNDYGYKVNLITNATRADILLSLNEYRKTITKNDNLLIYYAGHGLLDEDVDEGYWLPVDADKDNDLNWIPNSTITSSLKAIQAKHILIVADSCYSGTLTRGIKVQQKTPDHYARLAGKISRTVLTSGGLEPVSDKGKKRSFCFCRRVHRRFKRE